MTGLGCREWTDGAFCQQCNVTDGSRYYSVASSTCKECTGSTGTPTILTLTLTPTLSLALTLTLALALTLTPTLTQSLNLSLTS